MCSAGPNVSSCSVDGFYDDRLIISWVFIIFFFPHGCYDSSNFLQGPSVAEAAVDSNKGSIVKKSLECFELKPHAKIGWTHVVVITAALNIWATSIVLRR